MFTFQEFTKTLQATTQKTEATFLNKSKLLKQPLFVLEKFHPLALFIACGLLILMIEKNYASISMMEKTVITGLAGPLYLIDIGFESWRIATLDNSKTTEKINP